MDLEKELECIKRIQQGQEAWRRLCEDNERFVSSLGKQYTHDETLLNELIEAGNKGVLQAAVRYRKARGCNFFPYAVWFIRKAIEDAIAEKLSKDTSTFVQNGIIMSEREAEILNAYIYGEIPLEELSRRFDLTPQRINSIIRKGLLKLGLNEKIIN